MKKITLFILFWGFLAITSCEDVVDVPLEDTDELVVVDAWLTSEELPQTIRLSKTQVYFDSSFAAGITDASIQVSNSLGETFEFTHRSDGNYIWTPAVGEDIGEIGTQFDLTIEHGSEKYTSSTTLNRTTPVDSIQIEFIDDDAFRDDGVYGQFFARDPIGLGDTYWIKTYKNGQFLNRPLEINIAYDAGFDSGGEVDGLIFIPPIRDLTNPIDDEGFSIPYEKGDVIRMEIHSISNDAFAFMEIMRDQLLNGLNGIFAEPLANTRGNIQSTGDLDVLGVFNVAAVSSLEKSVE